MIAELFSAVNSGAIAATPGGGDFVDISVPAWAWPALIGVIAAALLVDLLVFHRKAHVVNLREAAIESAVWVGLGLAVTGVIYAMFAGQGEGSGASVEYLSAYLIEKSLSVDNVFVWAIIFSHFKVPREYQHRTLFWGIFGALVLRFVFIFVGTAVINRFTVLLLFFGLFLIYTGWKILRGEDEDTDPSETATMRLFRRVVPSVDHYDGQKMFTKIDGKRFATPLLAVLVVIEVSDVIFAVDSVPAVLAVSREQFIVFASNAWAILGLRALFFLLADMR
ncbi:MAG: TerC/Alx family metal homeostasis membrane protein, partial [Actinobacteria bacterium]|nr:TerC/Alx family metal homeostasis membrane protein [Actinomycetota bacterium]